MADDIAYLDATELAARMRARDLSPVEVMQAHQERIASLNPKLNAIVTLAEDAEDRASAAESAVSAGEELGPLHGVPFTIKDCIDTAGIRTARGSLLFADHVATADATVVERLRGAGGILLGKSNLPDFALWWETESLVFGRTVNPWNPDRTAGGSSGGEAAAIAAGLSPLGMGSDLGGSIRAPAHYCGVAGFKPTHGRIPLTGHFPDTIRRFMHVGPLARSVRDIALATKVLSGPDGRDWYAVPLLPPEVPQTAKVAGLRIGWLAEGAFGPVHEDVAATVSAAAAAMADQGAHVDAVELPWLEPRDCNVLTMTLYGGEGRPYMDEVIAGRFDELHPRLRTRLTADPPSLDEYVTAEAEVEALRRDLAEFHSRYDALLCPTSVVPAHGHDADEIPLGGQMLPPRTVLRATLPFNLTGSPALTVPFALSEEGLPIGVQVVGRRFEEGVVFRIGMALESARTAVFQPPI